MNIFKENLNQKFDYVFSSGVHNTKINNNYLFIAETMKKFDAFSIKGFSMNFLSSNVDYKEKNYFILILSKF